MEFCNVEKIWLNDWNGIDNTVSFLIQLFGGNAMHVSKTCGNIIFVCVYFKNFNSFSTTSHRMADNIYGLARVMNVDSVGLERNACWPVLNL